MLLIAAGAWGICIPIMKVLSTEQHFLAPETGTISAAAASLAVRFGFAIITVTLISRISPRSISKKEWWNGFVLGMLTAISMWIQIDGINYTSASTAGFLIAMYSIFIPLFTWISGRRKMTLPLAICCLLVIGGMGTLTGFNLHTFSLGRGEWESLIAAVLFSCQILWVDRLTPGWVDPERLTWVLCSTVSLFCLIALSFFPGGLSNLGDLHASARAIYLTAFLSILGTAVPFLIMNRFQSRVSPVAAGFIYCFEPITTAVGALFLPALLVRAGGGYDNENFTLRLILGGSLVLAANLVLLADRPVKTKS